MSKKLFISFILDETGSMASVKDQTIAGFNEYIETLKADPNTTNIYFTLTKFNSDKVDVVYDSVKLGKVDVLTHESYQPSAMTPLYDAIGRTIKALESKLSGKKKQAALVVIQTDGQENRSREFNAHSIFSMIDEKKKLGWTFVFLGADQDAWLTGQSLGLDRGNVKSYASGEELIMFGGAARASSYYASTGGVQSQNLFEESETATESKP